MRKYKLSGLSITDIKGIYRYTQTQFGTDQEVHYHASFKGLFARIGDNPLIGQMRPEIDDQTRSFVHQSHIVYYEIHDNFVLILRILHGRQDPLRHLP